MSWESTAAYYRMINELVRDELGGLHSAELVLVSIDFATFEPLLATGRWDLVAQRISTAAAAAQQAGAEGIVICTNTGHRVVDEVAAAIQIPVLSILDVVADAALAAAATTVGLLGTRFTMTEPFFVDHLHARGIDAVIPDGPDRETVDRIIFSELVLGELREESRQAIVEVIERLVLRGAEAVVLGCTELELLMVDGDGGVRHLPSTRLHAEAAVRFALSG